MRQSTTVRTLKAQTVTADNFRDYGQAIFPTEDGKPFDDTDAQLDLSQGTPRFYIMRLHDRGRQFEEIARHVRCTQCLGALGGQSWLIAVAPPSEGDCPDLSQLRAFYIPAHGFIKLHAGTWHAGPYFEAETVDFYNLELSDTNECDRLTYNFQTQVGYVCEIVPPEPSAS